MDFTHKKFNSRIIAQKLFEFKQDYPRRVEERVSTPLLPETQLKHKRIGQNFDFEERRYFGTKEFSEQRKSPQLSWNVAETQLRTQLKRSWNAARTRFASAKISFFQRRMWISAAHGEYPTPTTWHIELWLTQSAHPLGLLYELKIVLVEPVAPPFAAGQCYHCPVFTDHLHVSCLSSAEYVEQIIRGGLNTASVKGIRRGEVPKADHNGIKQQQYMEIYIDPTMTRKHGNRTLRESDHHTQPPIWKRSMKLTFVFQSTS